MPKSMAHLMKQAQRMQQQMTKMQEDLGNEQVEGVAGGGTVKVMVNGKQEVVSIKISPEAVDPQDVEMLEDLILAAINNAREKANELVQGKMGSITGGMKIPGFM
jgi:DNA-binding YbaB/EbfC family protein